MLFLCHCQVQKQQRHHRMRRTLPPEAPRIGGWSATIETRDQKWRRSSPSHGKWDPTISTIATGSTTSCKLLEPTAATATTTAAAAAAATTTTTATATSSTAAATSAAATTASPSPTAASTTTQCWNRTAGVCTVCSAGQDLSPWIFAQRRDSYQVGFVQRPWRSQKTTGASRK